MKKISLLIVFSVLSFSASVHADFVDNGNGTVTDTSTGLMWQIENSDYMTWEDAITYCEDLIFGGCSDWRLPNRNELQSIVDYTKSNPSIYQAHFPDIFSSLYWSSTAAISSYSSTDNAWYVDFSSGSVNTSMKTNSYRIRAVRLGN